MKHYEFTGETKVWEGRIIRRIRRLSDGKIGGWLESESNLKQGSKAWVDDEAMVWGDAVVSGRAEVSNLALISGHAKVSGYALVSGHAYVTDHAKVGGYAIIRGRAKACGQAIIGGVTILASDDHVEGD